METVRNLRAFAVVGGIIAVLLGLLSTPASARPLEREHFHEVGSEVITECGLTVRQDVDIRGTFLFNPHGPDGLLYGMESLHGTVTLTNLANGKTFTTVFNNLVKDLSVTDNGDGTLTIIGQAAGSFKVFGPDDTLLFNDPGQIRFELVIDHGGTPTDPSDDVELAFSVIRESTGRNDLEGHDFCTDLLETIG
ncbi:hypothetical protein [Actinophytocola sp.]|uniref:hypothetical protein n=1 Tax=Actinophytocola sp. TaxID=1872138 RepID=UPI002ECFC58C